MTLTRVTDHALRATDRLLEQFKDVPGVLAILNALNAQTQAIEDAYWQLFTERSLDTAVGEQLDVIGRVLDEPRAGFVDASYVPRLRAKIRVLRSSGGPVDILKIFKLLLPANNIHFTVIGAAGFILDIGAVSDVGLLPIYQRFLHEAKGAGIRAQLLYGGLLGSFQLSDNANPLVTENDATKGLGDVGNPATGGTLSGVIV
jgi:hypothetical protein